MAALEDREAQSRKAGAILPAKQQMNAPIALKRQQLDVDWCAQKCSTGIQP